MVRIAAASLSLLFAAAAMAQQDQYDKWHNWINEDLNQPAPVGPDDRGSATQNPPADLPRLSYLQWREPQEGAFTVDVPGGWHAEGGVTWNTIYSNRPWIRVRNPENTALVFIGDPHLLPRIVPNALYARYKGWQQGMVVKTDAQTSTLMDSYRTGEEFAWLEARTVCPQPQDLGAFRLPNETAQLSQAMAPFRSYVSYTITAGESYFGCGNLKGYIEAVTLLTGQPSGQGGIENWDVQAVGGLSASNPRDYEIAHQVYLRMAATYRINPQWRESVNQHLGQAAGFLNQASDAMEKMMLDSGQRALDAHTHIVNQWSNIILGQEHRCTDNGECQTTTNNCDYMWKNAYGMSCGPSDGSPPPMASGPWQPTHIVKP
jgi:hypothetical protein